MKDVKDFVKPSPPKQPESIEEMRKGMKFYTNEETKNLKTEGIDPISKGERYRYPYPRWVSGTDEQMYGIVEAAESDIPKNVCFGPYVQCRAVMEGNASDDTVPAPTENPIPTDNTQYFALNRFSLIMPVYRSATTGGACLPEDLRKSIVASILDYMEAHAETSLDVSHLSQSFHTVRPDLTPGVFRCFGSGEPGMCRVDRAFIEAHLVDAFDCDGPTK